MSTKDPTPEPGDAEGSDAAAEQPVDAAAPTDGGPGSEPAGATVDRQPPGPDDVPLSNLPPPSSTSAEPDPEDAPADGGADDPPAADATAATTDTADAGAGAEVDTDPAADGEAADAAAVADDEVDEADEPDADDDVRTEPSTLTPPVVHHRATWPRLAVVAVVVAIGASLLALAKVQQVSDLQGRRDDLASIESVSSDFGSAYLSYDFAHAADSSHAVTKLATSAFAKAYSAQSAPGIQQLFSSRQTSTRARTTAVYVGPVRPDSAEALVVVDITATSPTEGEQRLDDVSFVLDLSRTAHGWRVAKVARAPQPKVASTTTTAPAAK